MGYCLEKFLNISTVKGLVTLYFTCSIESFHIIDLQIQFQSKDYGQKIGENVGLLIQSSKLGAHILKACGLKMNPTSNDRPQSLTK